MDSASLNAFTARVSGACGRNGGKSLGRTKAQPACSGRDLAATHRSLWLGSRPRTGHREIFLVMKKKILLVDDDPGVRRMLQRVLEEEDYVVVTAADGLGR